MLQEGRIAFPQGMARAVAEHEARLVVGAMVRVRLNGECDAIFESTCHECGYIQHDDSHTMEANGVVGTIVEILNSVVYHHSYAVRFSEPVITDHRLNCGHGGRLIEDGFLAVELEIVDRKAAGG